jgi:hypothetical protein
LYDEVHRLARGITSPTTSFQPRCLRRRGFFVTAKSRLHGGKNQATPQQKPDFKSTKSKLKQNKNQTTTKKEPDYNEKRAGLQRKRIRTTTKKNPDLSLAEESHNGKIEKC